MIYKVFYQEKADEVPVREKTDSLYIEGVSERDVRTKLKDQKYNIEFVQPVDGAFLEYEKQSENFKVLDDLLGGEFYIDFDEFAIRDFPGNTEVIQNDLNNPNRVLHEGDIFGYHYDVNSQRAAV